MAPVTKEDGDDSVQLHCLTFTLLSGKASASVIIRFCHSAAIDFDLTDLTINV